MRQWHCGRALSPACARNRACPISVSIAGRSRINPTSVGELERGKPLAQCFWLPPPHPPPQAGEGGQAPCRTSPADARDVGAAGDELVLEALEPAVEVIDAVDHGLALGGERRDDERPR